MKWIGIIVIVIGFAVLLAVIIINRRVTSYSAGKIYNSVESVPADGRVAIVLGARVGADGAPSNTIYDRVLTGVELYKAGKTSKLLLSGGGLEPAVMKKIAIELGVPESDIIIDDLGLRTYDSCLRAKQIFNIDRAMIVSQDYHLARSLYLCQNMGIDAIAVNAKRRDYDAETYTWLREYLARTLAWYDINLTAPTNASE
ncbi:MAG: ElyC/SanA/YdcF family protein [Acidobacteriota bacterium]